ncbi:unnamed protein product [Rotaria socialis]|uniref:Uncharacterized protein n=1 Tax=Rotaria socialis TaxID=392032 RepID=A0A821QHU9_9BILA|nr:unnamed protein product [Rotaria socialis]
MKRQAIVTNLMGNSTQPSTMNKTNSSLSNNSNQIANESFEQVEKDQHSSSDLSLIRQHYEDEPQTFTETEEPPSAAIQHKKVSFDSIRQFQSSIRSRFDFGLWCTCNSSTCRVLAKVIGLSTFRFIYQSNLRFIDIRMHVYVHRYVHALMYTSKQILEGA